jgi:hypothetical protein
MYNEKVQCQCNRGMKAKRSAMCRQCRDDARRGQPSTCHNVRRDWCESLAYRFQSVQLPLQVTP